MYRSWTTFTLSLTLFALASLPAQTASRPTDGPIQTAFASVSEEVREFHAHVAFLAHPYLEGRLPGTRGMEIAREYVEEHLRRAGLSPAFGGGQLGEGATSYRQPFEIGSRRSVTNQELRIRGAEPVSDRDFRALVFGTSGEASGPVVFAGYGIARGRGDWRGLRDSDSIEGKIALIYRFEPLDEDGKSRWARRGPMSRYARLSRKLRDTAELNPAAILIVNPPACADPRSGTLLDHTRTRGSDGLVDVPVMAITRRMAEHLMAPKGDGPSLLELRKLADQGRVLQPLGSEVALRVEVGEEVRLAENVGGLLPGRGDLADELVVVGAHIDHLGLGKFGSRDMQFRGQKVHPGADDNATGAAAIMMMARTLVRKYEQFPEGQDARSVLFIGFDAEEQGLLGAQHYLEEPITPRDQHTLMINFDMIGRLTEGKISVQGLHSARGLKDLLQPVIDAAELEVVDQPIIPASDHWPFFSARIPVLFSICHSLATHPDYHTSRDTADRINAADAVKAIHLYDEFLEKVALHGGELPFQAKRSADD